jgi:hypothetical protein
MVAAVLGDRILASQGHTQYFSQSERAEKVASIKYWKSFAPLTTARTIHLSCLVSTNYLSDPSNRVVGENFSGQLYDHF